MDTNFVFPTEKRQTFVEYSGFTLSLSLEQNYLQSWSVLLFSLSSSARANADFCWRFQTCRATCGQANQKHETQTKGSHNQNPECISLSHILQSKTPFHTKIQTLLKGVAHCPLWFQLNLTWGFQVDYLRKMVICKHLQSRAFPSGACWGSTDNEWLFPHCKHSWHYSESSRCFSVHVF